LIILALFIADAWSQPRPVKLSTSLIIDTDCGMDDMRAISYLLARPEFTVTGIITSEGSLPPDEGFIKVKSLLDEFKKSSIPVSEGKKMKGIDPEWRQFNRDVSWGRKIERATDKKEATDYLINSLKSSDSKVTLVCLGPLTNIGMAIRKDPSVLGSVDRIVWYNESIKPLAGFNYECDRENADLVLKSKVRIDVISYLDRKDAVFDKTLAGVCATSGTELARILNRVYTMTPVAGKLVENHFILHDDLVALYITTPDLFAINTDLGSMHVRFNSDYNTQGVREAISDMIKGIYVPGNNVVFNGFPVNREMFTYDVRPLIDKAIALYGIEEWKANVMTDEFHGHLGVFSIVGAKMGIRAREIFGVGPDMLNVITFAGNRPPYSCLTDGIQVSTGATLGMGTISLAHDSIARPSAIFIHDDRAVRITLKDEYLRQVDSDINEGIVKFGLLDDGYWKLVRNNALRYWLEWDRNKIFEVTETEIPKNYEILTHDH
jgi:pyrimidine-specific ribonucleoside hydrolase